MPRDKLRTGLYLIIDLKLTKENLVDGPSYVAILLAMWGFFFLVKNKILNGVQCLQHLYITLRQDCCQVQMCPKYALSEPR